MFLSPYLEYLINKKFSLNYLVVQQSKIYGITAVLKINIINIISTQPRIRLVTAGLKPVPNRASKTYVSYGFIDMSNKILTFYYMRTSDCNTIR